MTRKQARQLWIDALHSGNYEQGHGYLHDQSREPTFCCLGVACDLFIYDLVEYDVGTQVMTYLGEGGSMPPQLAEILGLDQKKISILICLNDKEKLTFGQIAYLLETGLFWSDAPEDVDIAPLLEDLKAQAKKNKNEKEEENNE